MAIIGKALSLLGLRKSEGETVRFTDERGHGGAVGDAGAAVTPKSTLGLSAAWACANLISGTISSLPCEVMRSSGRVPSAATDHDLWRVLHESPNYDQTALDFWDFLGLSIEINGNGYARISRTGDRITALWPVPPDLMSVRRLTSGQIEYSWSQDGKSWRLTDRDVFHIRGPGGNPISGLSTLSIARNTLSSAIAAEQAAAGMFRNGLRPSGVIKFKEWLTPEQRAVADERISRQYVGAVNAGRPFIAEGGMEYENLTISPEDAQMLETRQFSVEEICRFFGVPPVMVGHSGGSTAWPTSVEQQVLMFQKFTLRRRMKRIEQAVSQQLLSPADRAAGVFVKFNIEGLLRGDSAARAAFYRSMTSIGAMTINEVRELENLPPVAGGDVPRMQKQNVPITAAGQEA